MKNVFFQLSSTKVYLPGESFSLDESFSSDIRRWMPKLMPSTIKNIEF